MAERRDNPLPLPPFPAGSGLEHIDPNTGQQRGRGNANDALAQAVAEAVASAIKGVLGDRQESAPEAEDPQPPQPEAAEPQDEPEAEPPQPVEVEASEPPEPSAPEPLEPEPPAEPVVTEPEREPEPAIDEDRLTERIARAVSEAVEGALQGGDTQREDDQDREQGVEPEPPTEATESEPEESGAPLNRQDIEEAITRALEGLNLDALLSGGGETEAAQAGSQGSDEAPVPEAPQQGDGGQDDLPERLAEAIDQKMANRFEELFDVIEQLDTGTLG